MKKNLTCAMVSYAFLARNCPFYCELTSKLQNEDALNAQRCKSLVGRLQHRTKVNLKGKNLLPVSYDIGLSVSRIRRWEADNRGYETLSAAPFLLMMAMLGVPLADLGDPYVCFDSSLRRTAMDLHWCRTGRRPVKADLLGVCTAVKHGVLWRDAEMREAFLDCYRNYESPLDAPNALKHRIGNFVANKANARLDKVDQEVFGGVIPHWPQVFKDLVSYFDRIGLEVIVAWDALEAFQPDELAY